MKTKLFTILLAAAASIGTMFAEKVQIGDLYYNLDATNQTAEVTSNSDQYAGAIIIPSSVTYNSITYSVTSIGNHAFDGCTGLTSVTIPYSVTSIGYLAFQGCSSLTKVNITDIAAWCNIAFSYSSSNPLYYAKHLYVNDVEVTDLVIPNSVTSIGGNAFSYCNGLTSVIIPNSVTSIGEEAFRGCSGLTSVTIPNSVTSIESAAFAYCTGLTSITIPNSVTSIGDSAFEGCSGLTSIIIPNSVTSIGSGAFAYCTGLTSITIPESVTSIGEYAFYKCTGLTSVTIPNSVTSIGSGAFDNCSKLTSIYVPCGEMERFKQLLSEYATIIKYAPRSIITIAENGTISLSKNDLTICDESVQLTVQPDYGYHFVKWSDGNMDNPRIVTLTHDTTFTAEFDYDRVGTCGKDLALVWSYDPIAKVLTIGNTGSFDENMRYGVEAPNEMTELVIGNNVTAIGKQAFAGIETLTKVSIGESVKTIGEQAFYDCVNLEKIYNYRPTPTNAYSTAFDGVDKFECVLYVLANSLELYQNASVWRDFYHKVAMGATETTTTSNNVTIEPTDNTAVVTWPVSNGASTYTIIITKDGAVVCTLIFNSDGQLIGIAFAPSRDGRSQIPTATLTANGMQFTVTGLNSGTHYALNLTAKDSQDAVIASYSSEFTTTNNGDEITSLDQMSNEQSQMGYGKFIKNGQLFIQQGDKTYNAHGARVK